MMKKHLTAAIGILTLFCCASARADTPVLQLTADTPVLQLTADTPVLQLTADTPMLQLPPAALSEQGAWHALNRLGFGPRPGEVQAVAKMGVDRWIARQFNPRAIPEPAALTEQLSGLPTLESSASELYRHDALLSRDKSDSGRELRKDYVKSVVQEAQTARLDRALLSDRQLEQLLVNFWYNHFNVFMGKGFDHVWVGSYENEAIRPYVWGPFRLLLEATARHPAMLFYLDNWQNSAPGSRLPHGKESGLNENYARELMELHTLGVDGGYSQKDVTELARVLTGWGLRDRNEPKGGRYGLERQADYSLVFDPARHDYGDKQFLGVTIHGKGWQEVEQALDLLAAAPATAHHICFQLAQYFVADQPDPALVDQMAKRYGETGGNLTEVMRVMIESPIFWSPATIGHKFKTPFEYAASSLRAVNWVPSQPRPIFNLLRELGQPIYGTETPDGYKQLESAWLTPDAMARRLSFATILGNGHLGDDHILVEPAQVMSVMRQPLSPATLAAEANCDPRFCAALLLGSPDFMYR